MGEQQTGESYKGWTKLEIMGHRVRWGYVSEQLVAGVPFVRIDIPGPEDGTTTELYHGNRLYALTPVAEEIARTMALRNQPEPVHAWELRPQEPPRALSPGRVEVTEDAEYYGPDDDDETDEIGL